MMIAFNFWLNSAFTLLFPENLSLHQHTLIWSCWFKKCYNKFVWALWE